jgi:putative ABC transport system permease protein
MWRHYLAMALRVMAADRVYTFINLGGLATGLAAMALLFLHVGGQLGFEGWLPDHQRTYRIDGTETAPGRDPVRVARAPGPLRDALPRAVPGIEQIARLYDVQASVIRDGLPFAERIMAADPNFFSVIRLPFVAGDPERALADPAGIAISERASARYFGGADPIGRRLTLRLPQPRDFTVRAVFRTLPSDSHMDFDLVVPLAAYFGSASEAVKAIPESWGGSYFFTYARLASGADPGAIEASLPGFVDRNMPAWMKGAIKSAPHDYYHFRLIPLSEVHFDGGPVAAMKPGDSRAALLGLSAIALLILAVAAVNFANLAAARSTLRAREVALRKVLGARRRQILVQFGVEALLLVTLAGLVGVSLVELGRPWLAALLGAPPDTLAGRDWQMWAAIALVAAVTAIVSGLYPATIVARIRPAVILASGRLRFPGGGLRQGLVIGQFAVSTALIAIAIVMTLQMRFADRADLGFDREGLLIVRAPADLDQPERMRAFAEAARRLPGIQGAALSSAVPSDESEDNLSVLLPGSAKPVQVGVHRVSPDFFATYKVRLLAGRAPPAERSGAELAPVVVNAAALPRLGLGDPAGAIGRILRTGTSRFEVAGVAANVRFRSLREGIRDEIYRVEATPGGIVSLRLDPAQRQAARAAVERLWRARFPEAPFAGRLLEDSLESLYGAERRQVRLVILFSSIAILLSCLGLFAMAAFSAQQRQREIAIRKLLGARSADIARLLLLHFAWPVLLANAIAWPAAWLVLRHWLDGFAYRVELPISAFLAASVAALAIALVAVAGQALSSARLRPAAILRAA